MDSFRNIGNGERGVESYGLYSCYEIDSLMSKKVFPWVRILMRWIKKVKFKRVRSLKSLNSRKNFWILTEYGNCNMILLRDQNH